MCYNNSPDIIKETIKQLEERAMNEKEISEIRRRFRSDKSNISHLCGCYVNEQGEIITEFEQSLALTPQEESERILANLKRTLSGTLGKNLIDISFSTQQVVDSEEHRLLMALRDSALKDEAVRRSFYEKVIETSPLEGNYMILLTHDRYDVPYHSQDGEKQDDASSEVYSYILCSICPVKMTKPALSYYSSDNMIHNLKTDWIVAPPELGFMFPSFDDRSSNIYNALYYSRDISEIHRNFTDVIFHCEIPMPAAEQKETFQAVLESTLADECRYDVIQAVHDELIGMIEEHKANKETEPLTISKGTIKNVLKSCAIEESRVEKFEEKYDAEFGEDTDLSPRNIVDRKFELRTPDVTIRVNPERSDLIETRIIGGARYILIRAEDGVEVNGVNVHITN